MSAVVLAATPTVEEVRSHLAAVGPDVDATLSVIGLVPLSVVEPHVEHPVTRT